MKIPGNLPDTTAASTERPFGAIKDVSAPGAGDGTPVREDWQNDLFYAFLATMNDVGISPDDSDESVEAGTGTSQFLAAMRVFVSQYATPGINQSQADISAGSQSTSLTAFEAGGGSEKEDGYTVRVRWTGGDGSFNHTITSAYTIGNELTGFITATLWKGEGQGELTLRLDKTNSRWIVIDSGIWDKGSNANGKWRKYANKQVFQSGKLTGATTDDNSVTFPVAFIDVNARVVGMSEGNPATGTILNRFQLLQSVSATIARFRAVRSDSGTLASTYTGDIPWHADGEWTA